MSGQIANDYFRRYADQSDTLAYIAAKNHRNGTHNPLAHMRKDLGYEFCATISDKNPMVASPLRRTDGSMVSDGAAALVLAGSDLAATRETAIGLKGVTQVNDYLPMSRRDMTRFEGAAKAWHGALETASLTLLDLDFVETHDCLTIAELIEYEAMCLTPAGEGRRAILEGGQNQMAGCR
ncbi:hypothetical protein V5F77_10545 [Xanthobacter sp. DSM 24535]|uniref:thiolase C-terminal domain-containing protein n=1 Tax=Roseixanthobacter psychrophilus TaxID=3119917 RepID=UPI00372A3F4B